MKPQPALRGDGRPRNPRLGGPDGRGWVRAAPQPPNSQGSSSAPRLARRTSPLDLRLYGCTAPGGWSGPRRPATARPRGFCRAVRAWRSRVAPSVRDWAEARRGLNPGTSGAKRRIGISAHRQPPQASSSLPGIQLLTGLGNPCGVEALRVPDDDLHDQAPLVVCLAFRLGSSLLCVVARKVRAVCGGVQLRRAREAGYAQRLRVGRFRTLREDVPSSVELRGRPDGVRRRSRGHLARAVGQFHWPRARARRVARTGAGGR